MEQEKVSAVIRLQEEAIAQILTWAEIGLPPSQFKQFKKEVFRLFHDRIKPRTFEILRPGLGGATSDNSGGKERSDEI